LQLRQFGGDIFIPPVHAGLARAAKLLETVQVRLLQADAIGQDLIALVVLMGPLNTSSE
jgi:hypothetical protein